jgi:hypothetical protein
MSGDGTARAKTSRLGTDWARAPTDSERGSGHDPASRLGALCRTRTDDPLLTIEQRGGDGGHARETAGTKAAHEEGIARRRMTARARRCPRWCSLSVPFAGVCAGIDQPPARDVEARRRLRRRQASTCARRSRPGNPQNARTYFFSLAKSGRGRQNCADGCCQRRLGTPSCNAQRCR